ncbi:unnamed protein product [Caenorhabditis brenneri]
MLLVAVVYGGCGFVGINLTDDKDLQIREQMAASYNVTPDRIHFVAVEYFSRDETGEAILNYSSIGTAIALNFVFSCMVVVIIVCGVRTYRTAYSKTHHLTNHMELHRQLFVALLIQTLTPTILIFIPCIIFYILPIFEIPLGVDSNILSISLMLYPMIDPIGVLFCIKNYRMYLKKFFHRRVVKRAQCNHLELKPVEKMARRINLETEESDIGSLRFDSLQN